MKTIIVGAFFSIFSTFICAIIYTSPALAANWITGDVRLDSAAVRSDAYKVPYMRCESNLEAQAASYWLSDPTKECMYRGYNFRLFNYNSSFAYISIGSDTKFTPLFANGFSLESPQSYMAVNTGSDTVAVATSSGYSIYTNFADKLEKTRIDFDGFGFDYYQIKAGVVPSYSVRHDELNGGSPGVWSGPPYFSKNGKYAAYFVHVSLSQDVYGHTDGSLIALVDLSNGSKKYIGMPTGDLAPQIAISDDGDYVASTLIHSVLSPIPERLNAASRSLQVWSVSGCGDESLPIEEWVGPDPCPSRVLSEYETISTGEDDRDFPQQSIYSIVPHMLLGLEFSSNGQSISLYSIDRGRSSIEDPHYLQTTVSVGPHSRLSYLALGDSYSSGEGDTEKDKSGKKYYRKNTNTEETSTKPREKCHISSRSYPYRLAAGMGLGEAKSDASAAWQSIACSGAKIYDMNSVNKDGYEGQYSGQGDKGVGRLRGYNVDDLQATALNEFIPGRSKQIEFVEKYRPKSITLTMGGNDVGFSDKVGQCVFIGTCDDAKQEGRSSLKNELSSRYDKLAALYADLLNASGGNAKIYVLGYPQFINKAKNASCDANVGLLNDDERKMIYNSIEYYNNVIEQAAKKAGVKYIDIEDSLDGHMLCDSGDKYVTGIAGSWAGKGNEKQETFHPNANGHSAIANAVWDAVNGQSLLDYTWCAGGRVSCPDDIATKDTIPTPANGYFDASSSDRIVQQQDIAPSQVKKQESFLMKVIRLSLQPHTPVNIVLHSDPIDFGDFTTEDDGSLEASISIPSTVPAGRHTLRVTGTTYSGEPIEYYQPILVTGANDTDLDEDNIPDQQQACGAFMQESDVDTDLDGIDDACDPEISDAPELYRVREGDPERTYIDTPEQPHYLYIERNTLASDTTGIANDDDPDGDGWAIVGVSRGVQYTDTTAPDTAPVANFIVEGQGVNSKPYVYLRDGGWGCVSFTPESLAAVAPNEPRYLKRTEVNADKCRDAAPEEDVDMNGQPDNEQLLYTARNGDAALGEDPSRIYLFRSFHAAEAQLGLSDYSPTGTAANTIAALSLTPNIGDPPNDPIFGASLQPIQEWNLLAASKQNEYIPAFNKLVIQTDTAGNPMPIVLTKKQNGQCIAYQPQNVDIIKFRQENNLMKMNGLPEGVGCE